MSVVIAVKEKDRVVLGADSQVSFGDLKANHFTKIWPLEEIPGAVIGGVGSARILQSVQHLMTFDKNFLDGAIDTNWIITILIPTITQAIELGGIECTITVPETGTKQRTLYNDFVFAYEDQAWWIGSDLSVMEIDDNLVLGSGSNVAYGALYATKGQESMHRIVTAVRAAASRVTSVDENISIIPTIEDENDIEIFKDAMGIVDKPKKKPSKTKGKSTKKKETKAEKASE